MLGPLNGMCSSNFECRNNIKIIHYYFLAKHCCFENDVSIVYILFIA